MSRENWFIAHVMREICQNLYVKRDYESPLLPSKSGLTTQFIVQDLLVFLQLHNAILCLITVYIAYVLS